MALRRGWRRMASEDGGEKTGGGIGQAKAVASG